MASPAKRPSSPTKFSETGHPVYIGVRRKAITCDRWVCEVRKANKKKRILVGTFDTAVMAARAHDVAAMALRDQSACLNFPDSKWLLHPPSTLSSLKDIKRAANEAAELFRPRDHYQIEDMEGTRSSTSSSESVEEKEVMSASSEKYDAFDLDKNGEMNPWSYYASLAEGLLMDPPVRNYEDLDEGESLIELLLWS